MTTKYDARCCYCGTAVLAGTGQCWKFEKTKRWYVGCDDCVEEKRKEREAKKADIRIEFPSMGATFCNEVFGVYQYDTYPRTSVLGGQPRRTWLDEFPTLEEAKSKFPNARVVDGTCFKR
jgi:hypothetical protein